MYCICAALPHFSGLLTSCKKEPIGCSVSSQATDQLSKNGDISLLPSKWMPLGRGTLHNARPNPSRLLAVSNIVIKLPFIHIYMIHCDASLMFTSTNLPSLACSAVNRQTHTNRLTCMVHTLCPCVRGIWVSLVMWCLGGQSSLSL